MGKVVLGVIFKRMKTRWKDENQLYVEHTNQNPFILLTHSNSSRDIGALERQREVLGIAMIITTLNSNSPWSWGNKQIKWQWSEVRSSKGSRTENSEKGPSWSIAGAFKAQRKAPKTWNLLHAGKSAYVSFLEYGNNVEFNTNW